MINRRRLIMDNQEERLELQYYSELPIFSFYYLFGGSYTIVDFHDITWKMLYTEYPYYTYVYNRYYGSLKDLDVPIRIKLIQLGPGDKKDGLYSLIRFYKIDGSLTEVFYSDRSTQIISAESYGEPYFVGIQIYVPLGYRQVILQNCYYYVPL